MDHSVEDLIRDNIAEKRVHVFVGLGWNSGTAYDISNKGLLPQL